jgi:hypothetical protein
MKPTALRIALLSLFALFSFGCPPKTPEPPDSGTPDTGVVTPDAGSDSGVDGGDAGFDAGFFCKKDMDCAVFKKGLRCETGDGGCVPAQPCGDDTNCFSADPDSYCYEGGPQCRCVLNDPVQGSGFPGVCRRRTGVCDECTTDSECGNSAVHQPIGACLTLQGDTSGKKYCLQQTTLGCGCGMTPSNGFCTPQNNSCASWGCGKDSDCDPGSVCNTKSCLCERKCRWDFAQKKSVPECGPNLTCWVDSINLDPTSVFYGAGRCKPPCADNTDCQDTSKNPQGGANLKCASEDLGGGMSDKRCRANGACMDPLECPPNPSTVDELGYCDRATFVCRTDCRTGTDPTTGKAFPDCKRGFACEKNADGGTQNVCKQQSCVTLGGTKECARGQFCCGEDRNYDGVAEVCPATAALEANKCFDPLKPPYCTECNPQNGNADCAGAAFEGMRPNDGGAALPSLCAFGGTRTGSQTPTFVCMLGAVNDFSIVNGQAVAVRSCPAVYELSSPPIDFYIVDPSGMALDPDNCKTDVDCNKGHDAGHCGIDPFRKQQDGGAVLSCLCDNANPNAWKCPAQRDGGYLSVCPANAGIQVCAQSIVCKPPQGMLFQPRGNPNYGCGL